MVGGMSPPWSSELAGSIRRDRQLLLVAFVELRARLQETSADDFPGGEGERAEMLSLTEVDYAAIVAAGAEATRLEAELEAADRQATKREADAAFLVIEQMAELVHAAAARLRSDT